MLMERVPEDREDQTARFKRARPVRPGLDRHSRRVRRPRPLGPRACRGASRRRRAARADAFSGSSSRSARGPGCVGRAVGVRSTSCRSAHENRARVGRCPDVALSAWPLLSDRFGHPGRQRRRFRTRGDQPHPSLIVRRGFDEDRVTTASVAHDPQPELAASSAGALFHRLQHGWFRWDFGQRRPHPVKLPASHPWVLAYERGGLLVLGGSQCEPTLTFKSRHQSLVIHAPTSTPALAEGVRAALSPDVAFPLARRSACRRMVDHSQDQLALRCRRRARWHSRRNTNAWDGLAVAVNGGDHRRSRPQSPDSISIAAAR